MELYSVRRSELLLLCCLMFLHIDVGVESLSSLKFGRHWDGFVGAPSKYEHNPVGDNFTDLWFEQRLDHFSSPIDDKIIIWKQRYFVNEKFYQSNLDKHSPVFLMVNGEAEALSKWMHQGAWIHYAEQFGALCFLLEHRFYGKSQPTSNLSVENLQYLTSHQALADVASFIEAMNYKYKLEPTQKWIVFGGSYAGNLVAWAREKYPHLIHGAISSSGPLLAKVDFTEYYDIVEASLSGYDQSCVESVKQAFNQIDILLRHMIGQRGLDQKLRTCTPISKSINNRYDINSLFENLASNFAGIVQYNKDNNQRATLTIDEACDIMKNDTIGPAFSRLAEINSILLNDTHEKCLDYKYDTMLKEMKNISWTSKAASGMRQWIWQTCNEFGYYQTSEREESLFGDRFEIDFFTQQCIDIYGNRMDTGHLNNAVENTNKFYGGLEPDTTNVLYIHGSIDPWHALGLTKTRNPKRPTIFIEGTAHCADMYEPSRNDSANLIKARNLIVKYLAQLLDAYRNSKTKLY